MNKVILIGRLTREPEVRYAAGENGMAVARYTLAVNRKYSREQQSADFISCVAFGKAAEFTEKYLHKGTKVAVAGRLQTGKYTKKNGIETYTTDVVIEEQEFAEGKKCSQDGNASDVNNGFMEVPDGIDDELPFN